MFLKKLQSPRFWAAVAGAVFIMLQAFGIRIPAPVINELLGCISAVLIFFGVIEKPKDGGGNGEPENQADEGGEKDNGAE